MYNDNYDNPSRYGCLVIDSPVCLLIYPFPSPPHQHQVSVQAAIISLMPTGKQACMYSLRILMMMMIVITKSHLCVYNFIFSGRYANCFGT
jgi:hypothetical protein